MERRNSPSPSPPGSSQKRLQDSRSRSRSRGRDRSRSRSKDRRSSRRSRTRSRSRSPRGGSRRSRAYGDDDEGVRLHIADLDQDTGKRELERVFGKYGPLKEIWMARVTPCFAFVVYRYKEDASEAQRMCDGIEVGGRRITVTFARPRTRGRGRRSFDPSLSCYQCGQKGHFSRDCREGTQWGYKRPPSPRRFGRRSRY